MVDLFDEERVEGLSAVERLANSQLLLGILGSYALEMLRLQALLKGNGCGDTKQNRRQARLETLRTRCAPYVISLLVARQEKVDSHLVDQLHHCGVASI